MNRVSLAVTLLLLATSAQASAAPPDCASTEQRQLDFWLGEWEVRDAGKPVATSSIERSASDCAIRETYAQPDGYNGTSLSFHDPVLNRWRQTWVDSTGSVGEFVGEFSEGAMRFTGETHRADGQRILRRMQLRPEADSVRQTSLASRDAGATWAPHYEYTYVRRKP